MIKGPKSDDIEDVVHYITAHPQEEDNRVVLKAYGFILSEYANKAKEIIREIENEIKTYTPDDISNILYKLYPFKKLGSYITGLYIIERGGKLYETAFESMMPWGTMGQTEYWDYFLTKELLGDGAQLNSRFFNEPLLELSLIHI